MATFTGKSGRDSPVYSCPLSSLDLTAKARCSTRSGFGEASASCGPTTGLPIGAGDAVLSDNNGSEPRFLNWTTGTGPVAPHTGTASPNNHVVCRGYQHGL